MNPRLFVDYAELEEKIGSNIKNIALGAVGIYTRQKFKVELQHLMETLNDNPKIRLFLF